MNIYEPDRFPYPTGTSGCIRPTIPASHRGHVLRAGGCSPVNWLVGTRVGQGVGGGMLLGVGASAGWLTLSYQSHSLVEPSWSCGFYRFFVDISRAFVSWGGLPSVGFNPKNKCHPLPWRPNCRESKLCQLMAQSHWALGIAAGSTSLFLKGCDLRVGHHFLQISHIHTLLDSSYLPPHFRHNQNDSGQIPIISHLFVWSLNRFPLVQCFKLNRSSSWMGCSICYSVCLSMLVFKKRRVFLPNSVPCSIFAYHFPMVFVPCSQFLISSRTTSPFV